MLCKVKSINYKKKLQGLFQRISKRRGRNIVKDIRGDAEIEELLLSMFTILMTVVVYNVTEGFKQFILWWAIGEFILAFIVIPLFEPLIIEGGIVDLFKGK